MIAVENEVTDIRDRPMRNNVLIHNFLYTPNEDLTRTLPVIFKQSLGVDVEFVRIHRNGPLPPFCFVKCFMVIPNYLLNQPL